MDNTFIGAVVGILLFFAGVLAKGKFEKRAQVREKVQDAQQEEEEGVKNAARVLAAKLADVRKRAEAEVADRPRTDDPLADLADRRQKHADIIRRHAARQHASGEAGESSE